MVIGSPFFTLSGVPEVGRAFLIFGNGNNLGTSCSVTRGCGRTFTATGYRAFGRFGFSISRAGDINGGLNHI